jgi:hypothetical protein
MRVGKPTRNAAAHSPLNHWRSTLDRLPQSETTERGSFLTWLHQGDVPFFDGNGRQMMSRRLLGVAVIASLMFYAGVAGAVVWLVRYVLSIGVHPSSLH